MRLKAAILFTVFAFLIASFYYILNSVVSQFYWQVKNLDYKTAVDDIKTTNVYNCINVENGKLVLNKEKLKDTLGDGGWAQILDEDGSELDSMDKPLNIPVKYASKFNKDVVNTLLGSEQNNKSITSLNRKNSSLKCITTVCLGSNKYDLLVFENIQVELASYGTLVVGVPKVDSKINIGNLFALINIMDWPRLITLILISIITFIIMYLLLGRISPYKDILNGIRGLTRDDYKPCREKGLYKEVYSAINELSDELHTKQSIQLARDRQLTNMVHEIKDSLAVIKGYSEILSQTLNKPENLEESNYANIILKKSEDIEFLLKKVDSGDNENNEN